MIDLNKKPMLLFTLHVLGMGLGIGMFLMVGIIEGFKQDSWSPQWWAILGIAVMIFSILPYYDRGLRSEMPKIKEWWRDKGSL